MDAIRQRMLSRMKELKLTPYGLSTAAGLEKSYIADFLKGERKKSISASALPAIATALDCDLAYLFGEQARPHDSGASLPLLGVVEPGVFREPDDGRGTAPVPADPRYPTDTQAAFRIVKILQSAEHLPSDGYCTVVRLSDDGAPADPRLGDHYVAERRQGDGVETFIVHACIHNGRLVLCRADHETLDGHAEAEFDRLIGRVIAYRLPMP